MNQIQKPKQNSIFKLKSFLFRSFFVVVSTFACYTLISACEAISTSRKAESNTFIASDKEISKVAEDVSIGGEVINTGLTESNIDRGGFYIKIDRIGLFKPIVKNVDPRYEDIYRESWKTGVSHGKFTALPGQIGNVYLFAHAVSDEARMGSQNAWFTKIDILEEDDEITIYYSNKKYFYQISRIYAVSPAATGIYTGVSPVEKVTLQTCGPPRGSVASRYIVEGLQVNVEKF